MASSAFSLEGRAIGVTGGGGHLGSAMVLEIARQGGIVFACGRTIEPVQRVAEAGRREGVRGTIVPKVCDVTQPANLESLLDEIETVAAPLYGWVNNAFSGVSQTLADVTMDGLITTMKSALATPLLAAQAAARRMQPHRNGAIVNISSMYGSVSPQPAAYQRHPKFHNPPAYGASKAGLQQLTRYLACHLAVDNIRVNTVSPGAFPSPEVQRESGFIAELEKRIPLGRIGTPDEIAGAVVFLLSDAARYITGVNLPVDGGWTAW